MSASNFISIEGYNIAGKYLKNPKYFFEEISLKSTTDPDDFLKKYGAIQGLGYCGFYAEPRLDKKGENVLVTRRPLLFGQCECGDYVIVNFKALKTGHTQSCGCKKTGCREATLERGGTHKQITMLHNINKAIDSFTESNENLISLEKRKERIDSKLKERAINSSKIKEDLYKKGIEYKQGNNPEAIVSKSFYNYNYNSKLRANKFKKGREDGISFELSYDFFKKEILKDCYYCGKPAIESPLFNGLDRVDNNVGYIESNVVPCCSMCNRAKGILTKEEYVSHLLRIAKHINESEFITIP